MTAFIDDYRSAYGTEPICKVLPIAPSTYYRHASRQANPELRSTHSKRDEALSDQIRRVWEDNFQLTVPVKFGCNCGVKGKP